MKLPTGRIVFSLFGIMLCLALIKCSEPLHADDVFNRLIAEEKLMGPSGGVGCLIDFNGMLVAGGSFYWAGAMRAREIVGWNGSNWVGFGGGVDFNVLDLCTFDNQLVAAGGYPGWTPRGDPIAAWNGSHWVRLGSLAKDLGLCESPVLWTMTTFQGKLFVGGDILAAWDGNGWQSVQSKQTQFGNVQALTVYDGKLYAGRNIDSDSSTLDVWNGTTWSSTPILVRGYVKALNVWDGKLIVAGSFTEVDHLPTNSIASWDGSTWSTLASGVVGGYIDHLTTHGGKLVVSGNFSTAGGVPAQHIATWNGSVWEASPSCVNGWGTILGDFDSKLVIGGWLLENAMECTGQIRFWDGSSCTPLTPCSGVHDAIRSTIEYDGDIIVGGDFTETNGLAARHIAGLRGRWFQLGSGLSGSPRAMAVVGGKLVVGGEFDSAGGQLVNNIASWDAALWSAIGAGTNGTVLAVAPHNGQLFAGGLFSSSGGTPARNIAVWNGSQWGPVGSGVNGKVDHLASWNGLLVASGEFDSAGAVACSHIAAWNGSSWQDLGQGTNGPIHALTIFDGHLIAGGRSRRPELLRPILSQDGTEQTGFPSALAPRWRWTNMLYFQ